MSVFAPVLLALGCPTSTRDIAPARIAARGEQLDVPAADPKLFEESRGRGCTLVQAMRKTDKEAAQLFEPVMDSCESWWKNYPGKQFPSSHRLDVE